MSSSAAVALDLSGGRRKTVRRRSPGRPGRGDAEPLRALYLQAALDVFIARGYQGASIEEIARTAKAGKVTFYRQFGNKAQLFRVVAHHAITKVRERLRTSLSRDSAAEPILRDIILRLHVALTDPEYCAVLRLAIGEQARFPELGRILLDDDRYLFEPVCEALTRAAKSGALEIDDPYAATMQLAALASGGSRFLVKAPRTDRKSRERWVAAVLKFALNSWRPRPIQPGD